jgi:hypothetical protein
MHLTTLLEQFGFTEKEAKIYLACLELGQAPVSSIARNAGEPRENTYALLKKLIAKGIAQSFVKGNSTFYSVTPPEQLLQSWETKFQVFKDTLPEFLALTGKYDNRPNVQFYEGLEGLKYLYKQIIVEEEERPKEEKAEFLIFVGAEDIDPRFQEFLINEFLPRRKKYNTPSKVIIPKSSLHQPYIQQNQRHQHLIIDTPIFDIAGEIILYGNHKVAVMMYGREELSALVITSKMLHKGLTSLFQLVREAYSKKV